MKSVDVARFLLPSAAMANVGLTINARALEYAIKKMLSSELEEVRLIGAEVKAVATQELPTLVKYADPIAFLPPLREKARSFANQIDTVYGTLGVTSGRLKKAQRIRFWRQFSIDLETILTRFVSIRS